MGPPNGWFAFEKHIPGELFTRNLLTLEGTVPPGGSKAPEVILYKMKKMVNTDTLIFVCLFLKNSYQMFCQLRAYLPTVSFSGLFLLGLV